MILSTYADTNIMVKKLPIEIVKTIKERASREAKENATFRLNKRLMDSFRLKCAKENVSMAQVLEELLYDFTGMKRD